ncbi:MAG: hypothetical protein WBN04_13475, partial [Paracoccaceae bacterium]
CRMKWQTKTTPHYSSCAGKFGAQLLLGSVSASPSADITKYQRYFQLIVWDSTAQGRKRERSDPRPAEKRRVLFNSRPAHEQTDRAGAINRG